MNRDSKHRLGAMAVKYNVGINTLISILKEKELTDVKLTGNSILSDEQCDYIDNLFNKNLELKQRVGELINEEMTFKVKRLLPTLIALLNLNKELNHASHHKLPWKASDIEILVKDYVDSIPSHILDNVKASNLISKELFDELDSFINKKPFDLKNLDKKLMGLEEEGNYKIDDRDFDRDYDVPYGRFCSACQQAPCMCSDPERSSTTHNF
jgi:hypothetical protein